MSCPIFEDQRALNVQHAADPKAGDCWNERFLPIALVLDVGAFFVAYLSKTKPVDRDHWTWDARHVEVKSHDEFNKWLSYGSIPGTWASVTPDWRNWKEFADEAKAAQTEGINQ